MRKSPAMVSLFLLLMLFFFAYKEVIAKVDHSLYNSPKECLNCHPRSVPTHKLAVPENMKENLPLDSNGRMACMTCHICKGEVCILRKNTRELCTACHDCTQGMACMIGVVHMGSSSKIEDLVHNCLACHDGVMGNRNVNVPGDHAVDIFYIQSKNFKTLIDKRVIFVDGKVGNYSEFRRYAVSAAVLLTRQIVIPAKAGIQFKLKDMDSRLRHAGMTTKAIILNSDAMRFLPQFS
ncbi:MAG: hypothetical protein HY806_00875 [Nitrospirae bacterium]|nr:hypothetical protein [Nitrospirota bacterium]